MEMCIIELRHYEQIIDVSAHEKIQNMLFCKYTICSEYA